MPPNVRPSIGGGRQADFRDPLIGSRRVKVKNPTPLPRRLWLWLVLILVVVFGLVLLLAPTSRPVG